MHPDDAAACVADEVDELRARLTTAPHLRTATVELVDRFELRVPFTKREYHKPLVLQLPGPRLADAADGRSQRMLRPVLLNCGPLRVRELILKCDCTDYDSAPITAELLSADGSALTPLDWPKELSPAGLAGVVLDPLPTGPYDVSRLIHPGAQRGIIQGHARPFFCRRGLREFHEHPQHEDVPWDGHRESLRIYNIVPELLYDLQDRWIFP